MDTGESPPATCAVRVVNVYATPWRFNGELSDDEGTPADLSGLEYHYDLYKEQLPQLLPERVLGNRICGDPVTLVDDVAGVTVSHAKAELFTLPSKQVVLTVTLCLTNGVLVDEQGVRPLVEVLEQCIFGNIMIGEHMVAEALSLDFNESPAKDFFSTETFGELGEPLLPERHQLVFVTRSTREQSVPSQQIIDKILYRSTPPYRREFVVEPRRPTQLNSRREQWADSACRAAELLGRTGDNPTDADQENPEQILGVVTPYVSLLYGHQKYVEASIFLSTVHAVGTAARFRHIWREAYRQVLLFREQKQKAVAGQQTRDDLEILADNLGNLEFDLTVSVEFPLLRIETFRSDLYEAMDLGAQANTLSQMFDQLGGSLRSEITAIEVREGRRTESRQRWNSIAVGLLSFIGVPAGIVFAFLGINTTEVPDDPTTVSHPRVSMWDPQYAKLWLIASVFALMPVFLIAFPYLREFARSRKDRRALWWGMVAEGVGVSLLLGAVLSDWSLKKFNVHQYIYIPGDAIVDPLGVFFILVGLTLLVPSVCRYIVRGWRYLRKSSVPRKPDSMKDLSPPAVSRAGR